MSRVDWSKAPEAEFAGTIRGQQEQVFYRNICESAYEFIYPDDGNEWIKQLGTPMCTPLIRRPDQAWTGEGLPPVGSRATIVDSDPHECYRDHVGIDVEILAHTISENDHPVAVYKAIIHGEIFYHALIADRFIPIRTPEQIAAEEIQRIREKIGYQRPQLGPCPVEQMYKLGYLKFEITEE